MTNEACTPIQGGTETVLLVEDDEVVRTMVRVVLEDAGYDVIEAIDGEEALERFQDNRERVQIVITDVVMPKKSGKEVYDAIKAVRPGVKALFMSGHETAVVERRGIIESGMPYLPKPLSPEGLLCKVRSILDG